MRAGIRDVVDMTQGTDELREAVERAIVWATNLRSATAARSGPTARKVSRGHIVSVFSSKGGSGKTFLTTNLAAAIAAVTGQDMAVVDLDVDMGDVFTYFGREPSATIHDLMELGEGATSEQIRERRRRGRAAHAGRSARRPDPGGRGACRRGRRQVPPRDPQRVRLRGRRRVGGLLGLRARLLRPVRHDLSRHRPRRRRREAPVEGARHAADDRPAARAVPRRAEPRRLEGRPGRLRRRAGHEDPGRRDDPVEPAWCRPRSTRVVRSCSTSPSSEVVAVDQAAGGPVLRRRRTAADPEPSSRVADSADRKKKRAVRPQFSKS